MADLQTVVDEIVEDIRALKEHGEVSTTIEKLGEADRDAFGIAIATADGETIVGGDSETPFSIQSISKVFALILALEHHGETIFERVGREPSGDPFNSIIDLERQNGIPRNPFINAGALVIVDMLLGGGLREGVDDNVRDLLVRMIGEENIGIDEAVYNSEAGSAYRNQALANFAKASGNLNHEVDAVIEHYTKQCAVALCCRQLAQSGRILMHGGQDPVSGHRFETKAHARRVLSLMLTCGQYDGAGDFAYRVGLPAKSGIAGGILAIVPDVASIAVWSPGLDPAGNSFRGVKALEILSERMRWSVFD